MSEPTSKSPSPEKKSPNYCKECFSGFSSLLGVRIPVLLCICFITFGNYFMYDVPGSLGWGIQCSVLPGDISCYSSPTFNFLGTPNENFCDPFKDSTPSPKDHCQISYGDSLYTSTTSGDCMADCWRTHPGYSVYGLQTVNNNGTFVGCFCALDFPDGHTTLAINNSNCNQQCPGVQPDEPKTQPLTLLESCGGRTAMTSSRYTCEVETIEMLFRSKQEKYTNTQNLSLYSIYSYTSVVTALLGGILIDKIGVRSATILFGCVVLLGEIVFAIGVQSTTFWLMATGQVVFGLAGESLTVAQTAYTVRWFDTTGFIAFAMGVTLSFSRIGSAATFALMPYIAQNFGVTFAVWIGVGLMVLSLLTGIVLFVFDYWAEKKGRTDLILINLEAQDTFKWSDLKSFKLEIWLCIIITVAFYCTIYPFNGIAKNFFNEKWGITFQQAGTVISTYTFFSAGISPVVGMGVDRAGFTLLWILLGCCLSPFIHVLMWLIVPTQANILVPVTLMLGIGLVLTLGSCTLWPAVPYVVDRRVLGTAFGFMTAIQNLGLALLPMLVGYIRDTTHNEGVKSFYYSLWIFIGCGAVAMLLSCVWIWYHWYHGSRALLANPKAREMLYRSLQGDAVAHQECEGGKRVQD